jgi:hypothetical protein
VNDDFKFVVCPAFAESISEGDLRWEKKVGDTVTEDEVRFWNRCYNFKIILPKIP